MSGFDMCVAQVLMCCGQPGLPCRGPWTRQRSRGRGRGGISSAGAGGLVRLRGGAEPITAHDGPIVNPVIHEVLRESGTLS